MNRQPILWRWHVAAALLLALLSHALTVWAIPRLIMDRIISIGREEARAQSGALVYLPPPIDHTQRRIVMPSPDLLYASCAFDLGEGPVRVQFNAAYPRYWSLALYAANSDTYLVRNDVDAGGRGIDLRIDEDRGSRAATGPGAPESVISPTRRGFLLLRLLVDDDPALRAAAEHARGKLACFNE